MKTHPAFASLLFAATAIVLGGCGEKAKKDGAPATAAAPTAAATTAAPTPTAAATTPAVAAAPAAVTVPVADESGAFDSANDPVLGWWRCVITDDVEEKQTSMLWPDAPTDPRSLRTIRFLNDGMATNGCCAGAVWTRLNTKFCKVDRDVHELYYAPDSQTLWFLVRTDAANSDAAFKKIMDAVAAGETPESLVKNGTLSTAAQFRRLNVPVPVFAAPPAAK